MTKDASSTGRRNTIRRIDSAIFPRENHVFGCTRTKASQSSVPSGLNLASDFGFRFQCQAGSSLALRRPIEITDVIGQRRFCAKHIPLLPAHLEKLSESFLISEIIFHRLSDGVGVMTP
jgi:hypothetical protein